MAEIKKLKDDERQPALYNALINNEKCQVCKKNSKRGKSAKNKGRSGETELAKELQKFGFNTRRTAQFNGKAEDGEADVTGLPGIHIECKRTEKLSLYEAMEQAERDTASSNRDEIPVVMHRRNRKPWLVIMKLDDWMKLYKSK